MKRYIPILIFLYSFGGFCQSTSEDSLLMLLNNSAEEYHDNIYYELHSLYISSDPLRAIYYGQKHLDHSLKSQNEEQLATSYRLLGVGHLYMNAFDSAEFYLLKAYDLVDRKSFKNELVTIIGNLGIMYSKRNQYLKSVTYYLEFIELARELNDPELIASGYNNIGLVYYRIDDINIALDFYLKCIQVKKENGIKEGLILNHNNLGLCYIKLKKFNLAFEAFKFSIENNTKNETHLANAYYGIANAYYGLNKQNEAIANYIKAIRLCTNTFNYRTLSNSYFQISSIYNESGNYKKALEYASKCLEVYENKKLTQTSEPYFLLSSIYENMGDIKKALDYKNKYIYLNDSLLSKKAFAEVKNLLSNHQLAENENIITAKNLQLKRNRQVVYLLCILIILLVIVLQLAYRNIRMRKRLNEKLTTLVDQRTQDLNSLLYRTSHDLAGPVATISGLIGLISLDTYKNEIENFVSRINLTNKKLEEIIKKLNGMSKVNSKTLELEDVNIESVVNNILNDIKNGRENHIIIKTNGNKIFRTDRTLIQTIIKNVLVNSFQHIDHREDKHIVKIVINNNGNLSVKISDNGKGIEKNYSERIFNLFYVANDKSEGFGLGLFQAKLAAERLKGDIKLLNNKKPITFEISVKKLHKNLVYLSKKLSEFSSAHS